MPPRAYIPLMPADQVSGSGSEGAAVLRVIGDGSTSFHLAALPPGTGRGEAERVIRETAPDMVCLGSDRMLISVMEDAAGFRETELTRMLRSGRGFFLLGYVYLSWLKGALGLPEGGPPGGEMTGAAEAAAAAGLRTVCCDRELQVTFRRAWERAGAPGRMRLLLIPLGMAVTGKAGSLAPGLRDLGIRSATTRWLSSRMPRLREVLETERVEYMAGRIADSGEGRVLTFLEPGDIGPVARDLERITAEGEAPDLARLESSREGRRPAAWVPYAAGVALIGAATAGALFGGGGAETLELIWLWVLANGILSMLGVVVAGGHAAAAAAAMLLAPVTSLFPFVGAGMVAGVLQYRTRRPRVMDFETLQADLRSIRGVRRNRLSSVAAVYAMANLGSILGSSLYLAGVAAFYVR